MNKRDDDQELFLTFAIDKYGPDLLGVSHSGFIDWFDGCDSNVMRLLMQSTSYRWSYIFMVLTGREAVD